MNFDSRESTLSSPKFPWYALQVRTRYERLASDSLAKRGYETFLPLACTTRQWSDRVKKTSVPLFPGYLFCRFNSQERSEIIRAPGVIQVVGYSQMAVPVDENEIEAIRTVVESGLENEPCSFLDVGDMVRITAGPLAGLEGILTEFRGNQRLVLSINLLQRSIAVELTPSFVAPRSSQLATAMDSHARKEDLEYVG